MSIFADLFNHCHWADALTWQAVLNNPSAVTDRTIRERLHHIHLCQHAWLRIWLGQPVDPHAGESFDLTSLAFWARQYHEGAARYLADLQEPQLASRIEVPGIGEEAPQPLVWESFLQITSHSTYHRGQVSARIRKVGGEPPQTDFITWVVKGRPEATWPNRTGL